MALGFPEPLFDALAALSEQAKDIEALARMAARLAGRDPDEQVKLALGGVVAFEGPLWRYPDFLVRAETAYEALKSAGLVRPIELYGYNTSGGVDGNQTRAAQ